MTATWATIQFRRDVQFPRYGMQAGELWTFQVACGNVERLRIIQDEPDGAFEFAGGQCLVKDIELIYVGQKHIERKADLDHVCLPGI